MLSLEIMPPLMFGGLVVFLLMGFPVAFSLSAVGLFFGLYPANRAANYKSKAAKAIAKIA